MGAHLEKSSLASLSFRLDNWLHTHSVTRYNSAHILLTSTYQFAFKFVLTLGYSPVSAGKSMRSVPLSVYPQACPQQFQLLQSQRSSGEIHQHLYNVKGAERREIILRSGERMHQYLISVIRGTRWQKLSSKPILMESRPKHLQ